MGTIIEIKPLVRMLGAFVAVSEVELSMLETMCQRRRTFVAGRDLVHQGQTEQAAFVLISGWA